MTTSCSPFGSVASLNGGKWTGGRGGGWGGWALGARGGGLGRTGGGAVGWTGAGRPPRRLPARSLRPPARRGLHDDHDRVRRIEIFRRDPDPKSVVEGK